MDNQSVANYIKESKYLSYLLRHGAIEQNLQISSDGFVRVDEILRLPQSKNYKMNYEIIKIIVNKNDKKRFELKTVGSEMFIRACQGHSINNLDENQMMQPISNSDDFPLVIHGTFIKFLPSIQKEGLRIMKRNHIHFATGYPGYANVISGMRTTCDAFLEIDLKKAMEDGIQFFVSSNGVVLTSGVNGVLHPKYFKKILKIDISMNENETTKTSKYLSYLLRHGARKVNLQISPDGFVDFDAILRLPGSTNYKLSRDMIESFVNNHNGFKRFELKAVDSKLLIRAVFGHSIEDVDGKRLLVMQPITNADDYPLVLFLTSKEFLPSIRKDGLNKKNKIHWYFQTHYPEGKVITGKQESLDAFIEIDMKKAMEDGIKFFIASNEILLTAGIDGVLDKKYFKNIKFRNEN